MNIKITTIVTNLLADFDVHVEDGMQNGAVVHLATVENSEAVQAILEDHLPRSYELGHCDEDGNEIEVTPKNIDGDYCEDCGIALPSEDSDSDTRSTEYQGPVLCFECSCREDHDDGRHPCHPCEPSIACDWCEANPTARYPGGGDRGESGR